MSTIYAFVADGFETVELLTPVDLLRRAGEEVMLISVTGKRSVTSAQNVMIACDRLIGEVDLEEADLYFLPGGMPGTTTLGACEMLTEALKKAAANPDKRIAAICAAPSVLGSLGLLEGKKATVYPGFESRLTGAVLVKEGVVTDGNITTARGMGLALPFGLELVKLMCGRGACEHIYESIQHD